jgi:hypothetical protein
MGKGKSTESTSAVNTTASEDPNTLFYEKVERGFRALFDMARDKHELHFAMALMPEMRGMQDAGWNTAQETTRAFDEYVGFLDKLEMGRMKCRIALGFYCHLAEASGFYEVPKNMLRIAGGEGHVLWPFQHLVEAHTVTGRRVAPNANKVLRDLAGHAKTLGLDELAEVFRDAFDPDVRNGYAHADYIFWKDGLRLRKRNGGHPRKLSWDEFNAVFQRGINFFNILRHIVAEYVNSYDPPKTIKASLNGEPAMDWTIYVDPVEGAFGITTGREIPRVREEKKRVRLDPQP